MKRNRLARRSLLLLLSLLMLLGIFQHRLGGGKHESAAKSGL